MTALDDRLAIYRPHIVREMREIVGEDRASLYSWMRYHLGWEDPEGNPAETSPGKLLRPASLLLAAEALGSELEQAPTAARGSRGSRRRSCTGASSAARCRWWRASGPGSARADHHARPGGTDTSAVALAAALGADRCDIFHRRGGRLHRRPARRCDGAQAD